MEFKQYSLKLLNINDTLFDQKCHGVRAEVGFKRAIQRKKLHARRDSNRHNSQDATVYIRVYQLRSEVLSNETSQPTQPTQLIKARCRLRHFVGILLHGLLFS